jgi:ankyrin repeat protein
MKALLDVVNCKDAREYTTLAFCAFKNHTNCFKCILKHAQTYQFNSGDPSLKAWADSRTDELFTALHFATYHGNFELIRILSEEMSADINAKNVYGANVLHIAA